MIRKHVGFFVLALSAVFLGFTACSERREPEGSSEHTSQALTALSGMPCAATQVAITANSSSVVSNASSRVDSYDSSEGPYGGSNVLAGGSVRAASTIVNNGGVIAGARIAQSPANLAPVPVPAGAIKLPRGASAPGDLNINTASGSLTLSPGDYVVHNLNVNSPGAIKLQPTGKVRIWLTGTLNLGGNENQNGTPGNLTFFVSSPGIINVNSGGSLFGNIFAPKTEIKLNSTAFGTLVGSKVTLNSGAALHFDQSTKCAAPSFPVRPPHPLPLPPRKRGCYLGTQNGWVEKPCTTTLAPEFLLNPPVPEIDSVVPAGGSAIPFEFGQIESTLVTFAGERDTSKGANSISLQGNTAFFTGPNGHQDWVQFVIQTNAQSGRTAVCVWNFDVTVWRAGGPNPYDYHCFGGQVNGGYNIAKRSGDLVAFDFATAGGSVFKDVNGDASIGMVAQLSWYDPNNDPGNDRGLYSVVAPDTYGLAGRWTGISGDLFGMGGGSEAVFTDASSVLTRTLAGSCANASGPAPEIPWPGVCPDQPPLLPNTTITTNNNSTGETSSLVQVGNATSLVAFSPDLVATQVLSSTSGDCVSGGTRAFVRDSATDTGSVPSNLAGQSFWDSPDIFLVPHNATVSVDAVSSETLLTPNGQFDIYIRVNNDFGCDAVQNAQAQVYLADPSALDVQWTPITNQQFQGNASIPAGGRALIGPFPFTAPSTGLGDGHKCLIAAIRAQGENAPTNLFDAPNSFQVAQRNVQFSECAYPLTNATTLDGQLSLTLSASGAAAATTGPVDIKMTFDDPSSTFFAAWSPGSGSAYTLTQAGGLTSVRLGQPSVLLAAVPLLAGQTVIATGDAFIGSNDPPTTLTLAATLRDGSGNLLVQNGGSCVIEASQGE